MSRKAVGLRLLLPLLPKIQLFERNSGTFPIKKTTMCNRRCNFFGKLNSNGHA